MQNKPITVKAVEVKKFATLPARYGSTKNLTRAKAMVPPPTTEANVDTSKVNKITTTIDRFFK